MPLIPEKSVQVANGGRQTFCAMQLHVGSFSQAFGMSTQ